MKKGLLQVIILACIMSLWGCGKQEGEPQGEESPAAEESAETIVAIDEPEESIAAAEESEEDTEMSGKRMTREYIIEQNLFTEEELEGVDVEEILERYKWNEGDENDRAWRTIFLVEIEEQQIAAGVVETIDYSYLLDIDSRENGLAKEELESVKTLVFQYNSGTYFETILLDKENGKMYLGETCDLLAADVVPPVAMDLEEKTWDAVVELLDSCDVVKWKKRYQGTSSGTSGYFWWFLLVELENGEVCNYSGEGVMGKSTPEQYQEFAQGLKKLFE